MSALALAALVASAAFSSPVPVSPVGEIAGRPLVEQADLVEGAWLQFRGPGGERLVRIGEDGRVAPVGLPPQLRDERLRVSPLQNGWTVAGVASSNRPEINKVGATMLCTRSTTLQSFSVPTQKNSLGPFIVWYTVGSSLSISVVRTTSGGFGTTRQTCSS